MILLTFNIINSDAESNNSVEISTSDRTKITQDKTNLILKILNYHDIKASFFIEISIIEKLKTLIKAISAQGHEIAFYNENSTLTKIEDIKKQTEELLQKQIRGIRQKEIKYPLEDLKSLEFNYVSNIDNSNILFVQEFL